MTKPNKFRIAIVGRPNVGKSTLFNRLLGRRIAITDSQPGATRDAVNRDCVLEGKSFVLLDTGGCRPDPESELEALAIEKSMEEAQSADLVLFVMECGEPAGEDLLLVQRLRKRAASVIVVANKCDSIEKEHEGAALYRLGFKTICFVSAEHNRNIEELAALISKRLPEFSPEAEFESGKAIKIAVLGRPNAGKSTLSNALSSQENSIVSPIAGVTRDTVVSRFAFKGQEFEILDTAGMRRRAKVAERLEYYAVQRAEEALCACDVALLLLDAEQGLADQDKKIADKIIKAGKAFIFVLNKWDLKEKEAQEIKKKGKKNDILKDAAELLRYQFPVLAYAEVAAVSAREKTGLAELLQKVKSLYKQAGRMISDAELQKALPQWVRDRNPSRKGRTVKIKSLRQTGARPPRFTLRAQGQLEKAYERYIQNRLRQEFGFKSSPIILEVE